MWAETSQSYFTWGAAANRRAGPGQDLKGSKTPSAEPSNRAGWRLSLAPCHRGRTKVSPRERSQGGKCVWLLSAGQWPSCAKMGPTQAMELWPGTSGAQHAGHHWQNATFAGALPTQPAGTLALGGAWAVPKHVGEEKMQPPARDARASSASQLRPITAKLMIFALIKAPAPGALSILKTNMLHTLRKSLKI